jgi:hypothetical protein
VLDDKAAAAAQNKINSRRAQAIFMGSVTMVIWETSMTAMQAAALGLLKTPEDFFLFMLVLVAWVAMFLTIIFFAVFIGYVFDAFIKRARKGKAE